MISSIYIFLIVSQDEYLAKITIEEFIILSIESSLFIIRLKYIAEFKQAIFRI